MYLLDTPIISELRKARTGKADPGVVTWAGGVARQNMYVSAVSLLELENGIAHVERKDRPLGEALRSWLDDQVMVAFEGRILAVDAAVVRKRGALPYADGKGDRDALVAATALVHGLTVVARHVSNFRAGRVKVFSPWGYAPEGEEAADWQETTGTGPVWLKNLFLRF
ncbi:putative plasmid stability protein y4jK [Asticcacaulis biprosthecium C19]|uniref:Putative plasmid stability protein y4jK n=1 Tax=Asticcacaulis biprosthecium C19 TaxID=715226 RepID=F4QSX5_9CAUL|nr:type II toxin-antitoxin system VapC family toxin [Asticcacaulis biprosthecium]EGF89845.1 putative plasmid stability protein y4jK [Asticcacaulis biprosthecium C19]